jgi:hypothetical protein
MEMEPPLLSLSGPDVERRFHSVPETARRLIRGTKKLDGGCSFSDKEETSPGPASEPEVFSLAEVDFATCDALIATHDFETFRTWYESNIGELRRTRSGANEPPMQLSSPAKVIADGEASLGPLALSTMSMSTTRTERYEAPPSGGGGGGGGPVLAWGEEECTEEIGTFSAAWQDIWTVDPVYIEVGRSEHDISWAWHYDWCVNYMSSALVSYWFSTSGWELQGHYHWEPEPAEDWSYMINRPIQKLRNTTFADTFCAPVSVGNTYIEYRNYIDGWHDGHRTFWTGFDVYGGCSFLLTTFWMKSG